MKKPTSYEIAFSAVSASFSLLFVWLSTVVSFLSITFSCIAAVMLMLPLTLGSLRASFLSYIAVSALSFAVTAFPNQMPFVLFFGFYSFAGYLINLKIKPFWLGYIVKLVYFNLILFIILKFLGLNLSDTVNEFVSDKYYVVAILGSILFLVYDYAYYAVLNLLTKLVKTRLKIKIPKNMKREQNTSDLFDDDFFEEDKNKKDEPKSLTQSIFDTPQKNSINGTDENKSENCEKETETEKNKEGKLKNESQNYLLIKTDDNTPADKSDNEREKRSD